MSSGIKTRRGILTPRKGDRVRVTYGGKWFDAEIVATHDPGTSSNADAPPGHVYENHVTLRWQDGTATSVDLLGRRRVSVGLLFRTSGDDDFTPLWMPLDRRRLLVGSKRKRLRKQPSPDRSSS